MYTGFPLDIERNSNLNFSGTNWWNHKTKTRSAFIIRA